MTKQHEAPAQRKRGRPKGSASKGGRVQSWSVRMTADTKEKAKELARLRQETDSDLTERLILSEHKKVFS